ncbi:hypothetical protein LSUE1_G001516 [Lachnellula suecica]|uniref:Ankyrin n=1 Tax=Lachnellula suecica TaxID=602035 RepID=A0A8T9CJE5_9HELO|nr:hypothetical protein LSUE1_G001516 [Lachnellula suecica]
MDSPSASSATLSIRSDEYEILGAASDSSSSKPGSIPFNPDTYIHAVTELSLSPSMRAASNPDPSILEAVLSYGYRPSQRRRCEEQAHDAHTWNFPSEFSPNALRHNGRSIIGITTPVMEAIRARLPSNVKTLLDAGANPNGVPFYLMEKYAALFLRFRPSIKDLFDGSRDVAPRHVLLRNMNLAQISSLTCEEVGDRFYDGMAPFWCEENFTHSWFWTNGETMPSLVEAARSGSIEMVEMLLQGGADASFWMSPQFYVPEPATYSSLAFLLEKGLDANTMALANPTRCLTPAMLTIVDYGMFNNEIFQLLARQPNMNFEIRTPVYGVHILHFAVARLDLELLKFVSAHTPLRNAGYTALGHTLLHIACMPANASQVLTSARVICRSIHETRDLRPFNDSSSLQASSFDLDLENQPDEFEARAQADVVKFIFREIGDRDIGKVDVHGNTALHYLAGCRFVNQELLDWMLTTGGPEVEKSFETEQNIYGYSAVLLLKAGNLVRVRHGGAVGMPFDRSWSEERTERKARIWRELLDLTFIKVSIWAINLVISVSIAARVFEDESDGASLLMTLTTLSEIAWAELG